MLKITFGARPEEHFWGRHRGSGSPGLAELYSSDSTMSERELQSILDNSTAVIYVKDTGGRYLRVNRRFEDLFGVSRTEVLGRTDYDLFPREMADRYRAHDQEV